MTTRGSFPSWVQLPMRDGSGTGDGRCRLTEGPAAQAYAEQLAAFLRRTHAIHAVHPELFFAAGYDADCPPDAGGEAPATVVDFPVDGPALVAADVAALCASLASLATEQQATTDSGDGSDAAQRADDAAFVLRGLTDPAEALALADAEGAVPQPASFSSEKGDAASLTSLTTRALWRRVRDRAPRVFAFAVACARLRLHRRPVGTADIAAAAGAASSGRATSIARALIRRGDAAATALIVAQGGNAKKQHEVMRLQSALAAVLDGARDVAVVGPPQALQQQHHQQQQPVVASVPPEWTPVVPTVLNFGEGKGHASCAFSLVSGLHVIGLDCNAAHRAESFDRASRLLTRSVGSRGKDLCLVGGPNEAPAATTPNVDGGPTAVDETDGSVCVDRATRDADAAVGAASAPGSLDGFLYRPHGAMTAVTCRVDGGGLDWRALLDGHVPLLPPARAGRAGRGGGAAAVAAVAPAPAPRRRAKENSDSDREPDDADNDNDAAGAAARAGDNASASGSDGNSSSRSQPPMTAIVEKVRCLRCGAVRRLPPALPAGDSAAATGEGTALGALLLHVTRHCGGSPTTHAEAEPDESWSGFNGFMLPPPHHSPEELAQLPPARLREALMAHFVPFRPPPRGGGDDNSAAAPAAPKKGQRLIARGVRLRVPAAALQCGPPPGQAGKTGGHAGHAGGRLPRTLSGVSGSSESLSSALSGGDGGSRPPSAAPEGRAAAAAVGDGRVTVVVQGFSESAGRYRVALVPDPETRAAIAALAPATTTTTAATDAFVATSGASGLAAAVAAVAAGKPIFLEARCSGASCLAPLPPSVFSVCPDTLSTCGMTGLHTCGDLGSSICKLFAASRSPALLLVSCCWHVLTPDGHPLSAWARRALSFPPSAGGGAATAAAHLRGVSLMLATLPAVWPEHTRKAQAHAQDNHWRRGLALAFFGVPFARAAAPTNGGASLFEPTFLRAQGAREAAVLRAYGGSGGGAAVERVEGDGDGGGGGDGDGDAEPSGAPFAGSAVGSAGAATRRVQRGSRPAAALADGAATARTSVVEPAVPAARCSRSVALFVAFAEAAHAASVLRYDGGGGGGAAPDTSASAATVTPLVAAAEAFAIAAERRGTRQRVAAFVVLRAWLSPLLEAALLLDRCAFLADAEASFWPKGRPVPGRIALVPLFDPTLSPRNYGIIATRKVA